MTQYFDHLTYKDGIYYSSQLSPVHYPLSGNATFSFIEDNSFWYKHRNNCILKVIDIFQPQGNIVEIGGGNGYVSKAIQDHGCEVILIEPDINGVLNAQKRGIKNLICSSFYDLEWADKKMDNVALFDVLEHIENDVEFLQHLSSHLKNKAFLFMTVPSHNGLFSMEDVHDGHFRRYSLGQIKKLLLLSGFEISYKTYIFGYLFFPIYFLKVLATKFRIGKFKSIEKYKFKQEADKYTTEHLIKSKLILKILDFFHKIELKNILKRSEMAIGSSCLIVARKKS